MSTPSSNLVWPKGLNQDVVQLLDQYFCLVDSKDQGAGQELADHVFAEDAKWYAASGCFEGRGMLPISLD